MALLLVYITPVHAESVGSVVVIDSGINTSLFKDNVVYEVCILSKSECPNGKSFMEGLGASKISESSDSVLNHGTNIVSVMTQVNPSIKIIPIRIVGINKLGNPENYTLDDIDKALRWVTKNQKKYNISVVNISQGNTFNTCDVSPVFKKQVFLLKKVNVPVIAAAGNDGNNKLVFTPACWKETISIGASDFSGNIQPYSNLNGKVDFYVQDNYNVLMLNGDKQPRIGTSNSTAAFSTWWLMNNKGSIEKTYKYALSVSTLTINSSVKGFYVRTN